MKNSITTKTQYNGKEFEITVKIKRKMVRENCYADGWDVKLAPKEVKTCKVVIKVDGKDFISTSERPSILDPASCLDKVTLKKNPRAYAQCGWNRYLSKGLYDIVIATIAECEAGMGAKYAEAKIEEAKAEQMRAEKEAKAEKKYQEKIKNGWCPKCQSYCYGDCEA